MVSRQDMAKAVCQRRENSRGQRTEKAVRETEEESEGQKERESSRVIRRMSSWGREALGTGRSLGYKADEKV